MQELYFGGVATQGYFGLPLSQHTKSDDADFLLFVHCPDSMQVLIWLDWFNQSLKLLL
jgi:hypothetical protein